MDLSGELYSCVICLEELNIITDIEIMDCVHIFHLNCIDKWMKQKYNCRYADIKLICLIM